MSTSSSINPGLCATCQHAKVIRNARGSIFWLCEAHKLNPKMPKYPALPVKECRHYKTDDDNAG